MIIKDILFPTDFSESANKALPHALMLASVFDSNLTTLHVRTPFVDDPNRPEYCFFNDGGYAEYVENQLQETIAKLETDHHVRSIAKRDISAAAGILNYIEMNPVDIVVMGTHGRSALGQFFLGGVAEKVVRHAQCPVLTVAHHRNNYQDNPKYRKILAAFDFSDYSIEAIRKARELAIRYDASLEVLYVVVQQVHPAYYEMLKSWTEDDLPAITGHAREALNDALANQGLQIPNVHVVFKNNRASEEIVDFAKKNNFELIVMGTHGLAGIKRVLLGSTTERVVRTAPCPVLTIHKE